VGGHSGPLREALTRICGGALRLPPDVVVVQVGDLVDRGPDSTGVLELVRTFLDEQPDQWIQLAGNHESQYLPGGTRFWREPHSTTPNSPGTDSGRAFRRGARFVRGLNAARRTMSGSRPHVDTVGACGS
jgi:hypothetical protein